MAGDAQTRFEKIMNKLSQSASSRQKQSLISSDGIGRKRAESGLRVSTSSLGSVGLVPQCRPWDRRDLMRRLATFKAMTWFGKPKAVSPVNCARRGWINVEMDVISCEACGARLLFSTPSSWTLQQVEKAAAVFSLKLDSGHKLLCPWIDNACDEKLALFPPTPPPALVDNYKERLSSLLCLTALPVISSSAIDYMKCPQLEHLLLQSCPPITLNNGIRLTDNPSSKDIVGASEDTTTANMYYQAQKIISLCGWEPCLLPYVVDVEDKPSESSGDMPREQRNTPIVYTSDLSEVEGGSSNHPFLGENQYDPASVVLDCRFCGARVGLWSFAMVQRPLEYFTLIANTNGEKESATGCTDLVSSQEVSKAESSRINHQNVGSTSKERSMGLNLTIAGGPPPTKQNFRPVVSFPIVSRHLRAEFASTSGKKDYLPSKFSSGDHKISQIHSQIDVPSQQERDVNGDIVVSPEVAKSLKRKRNENESFVSESNDPSHSKREFQAGTGHVVISEEIMPSRAGDPDKSNSSSSEGAEGNTLQTEREATNNKAEESVCVTSNADVIIRDSKACENNSVVDIGDICNSDENTSKVDSVNAVGTSEPHNDATLDIASCSATNATLPTSNDVETERGDRSSEFKALQNAKANDQETSRLESMLQTANRNGKADHGLGDVLMVPLHHKISEFDPIRQHRPFCPWIAPEDGESVPGWRLTLNALIQQEKVSSPDPQQLDTPSNLIDTVDDPIVSIRKLFMSPPTKRLKSD